MNITEANNRIDETVAICNERIGEVWSQMFPEVRTGDFPPDAAFNLDQAIQEALEVWLDANAKSTKESEAKN